MRGIGTAFVAAVLLFGCAPVMPTVQEATQAALPKFLGIEVGRTVLHSGCYRIANCIECFEYCPYVPGWTARERGFPNPKPEYVEDSGVGWHVVGVDKRDVVQVMEIHTKPEADARHQVLMALQAAFGRGDEQGGRHIVWHPAGGLVDFYETTLGPGYGRDDLYIFSPAARGALPTLLPTAAKAAGPRITADTVGVFGVNLGDHLSDCTRGIPFPSVGAPCFNHSFGQRAHDPHLNPLEFPNGGVPEILSSGTISTETDAEGIQSMTLATRGLAVQDAVMRDLETLFGPAEQRSGGGANPIIAQWMLGDRTVRFEGVAAADGRGRLRMWTPQGKIYDDEAVSTRQPVPLIPLLRYTPPPP